MKELTLTAKEQNRLQTLNGVLEKHWPMQEAAKVMGVSERHGWRILTAYRKEGAATLAHGNRGRTPANVTPQAIRKQVVSLAKGKYSGVNHTHLAELLAEREGIMMSRSTLRRVLSEAGLHVTDTGVSECLKKGYYCNWMAAITVGWRIEDHG